MGLVYVIFGIAAAVAIWTVISPRSAHRNLVAWTYRNPEAHEPSDASYAVQRYLSVVLLVVIAVVVGVLANTSFEPDPEAVYQECLEEYRSQGFGDGLLTPEDWCEDLNPQGEQEE